MRSMKSRWFYILIAILAVALAGCSAGSEQSAGSGETDGKGDAPKGEITFGITNWSTTVSVTNLWKEILEEQGYTVHLKELGIAAIYNGVADGSLDVYLDVWLPITHGFYIDEYGDGMEDYGNWFDGQADLGLVVPAYVEEVNSIADLEEHKGLFNGKIVGIEAGAGIMKLVKEDVIPGYGLTLDLVSSSEAAMLSALKKAIENEEPIVVTGWRPHWKFAEWDLKYLEDPKKLLGEPEEIHTVVRQGFTEEHPEVAAWLKNFRMTDEQFNSLISYVYYQYEELDHQEAVRHWMEDNRSVVDSWLEP